MKNLFAATLIATASAVLEVYEPRAEWSGVAVSPSSRYWLNGTYGTNDIGYWGDYNFIYWNLGGAEIP